MAKLTAQQAQHWQGTLLGRKARMLKFLNSNAPDVIILAEAKNILVADARGSKWLAIWRWIAQDALSQWNSRKIEFRRWSWQLKGWPEQCAIGLATGDILESHKKQGCDCEKRFEDDLMRALERER